MDTCCQKNKKITEGGVLSGLYGLAFVGALVYYIQHATMFRSGVVGFFKALIWPAMLVYRLLEFFKMQFL